SAGASLPRSPTSSPGWAGAPPARAARCSTAFSRGSTATSSRSPVPVTTSACTAGSATSAWVTRAARSCSSGAATAASRSEGVTMAIYALGDVVPDIDSTAYVHPDAVVIGDVTLGPEASVWPGAVLRGDPGGIVVGARTSVQDGTVVHTTPLHPTRI